MEKRLKVVVADAQPADGVRLETLLGRLGHETVAVTDSGEALVEACHRRRPDLVIADLALDGKDGAGVLEEICRVRPVPAVCTAAACDATLLERIAREGVLAVLLKPFTDAQLEFAIRVAMCRFTDIEALRRRVAELEQALEDRKLIERAKGILMRQTGLDEQGAYSRLRRLAREKNLRMREIARMILTAEEAFQREDPEGLRGPS